MRSSARRIPGPIWPAGDEAARCWVTSTAVGWSNWPRSWAYLVALSIGGCDSTRPMASTDSPRAKLLDALPARPQNNVRSSRLS